MIETDQLHHIDGAMNTWAAISGVEDQRVEQLRSLNRSGRRGRGSPDSDLGRLDEGTESESSEEYDGVRVARAFSGGDKEPASDSEGSEGELSVLSARSAKAAAVAEEHSAAVDDVLASSLASFARLAK